MFISMHLVAGRMGGDIIGQNHKGAWKKYFVMLKFSVVILFKVG
jgi:hypothetical protein